MNDDDPDDVVHDAFAAGACSAHPLGRPMLGTADSIEGLTADARSRLLPPALPRRRTWWSRRPATSTTPTWSGWCAGVRRARRCWPADRRPGCRAARRAAAGRHAGRPRGARPAAADRAGQRRARHRRADPRPTSGASRSACSTRVLGGGMSSRLFQEVREKRGLAYSVYSFAAQYADAGLLRRLRGLHARARSTRCSRCAAASSRRSPSAGITEEELRARQGPAARRRWCSAWRTPARG